MKKYTVNEVIIKVISIKGKCGAGLKVGDEFPLDLTVPAGMCGLAFANFVPLIEVLRYDGKWPWWEEGAKQVIYAQCTDPDNSVLFELRKGKLIEIV
jgi:uncharacterized repeat protein (TIGR04076 family)